MPALDKPLEHSPEGCCWLCVHETLSQLNVPDIQVTLMRKLPWPVEGDAEVKYPCFITSPAPEAINPDQGTNERDDIQYAIMVGLVAAGNRDNTIATAGWLLFCMRETRKAFLNKRDLPGPAMPTGCDVLRVVVEPGAKYIDPATRANFDAAFMLVRFTVRETRN